MERSEAIRQGIGVFALALIKPARIPAEQPSVMKAKTERFYAAWEEAWLAQHGGEPKRARYYHHQALKAAPEDVEAEALADIFESLNEVNRTLAHDEAAHDERTTPRRQVAITQFIKDLVSYNQLLSHPSALLSAR
jgi:hypothetical protein